LLNVYQVFGAVAGDFFLLMLVINSFKI